MPHLPAFISQTAEHTRVLDKSVKATLKDLHSANHTKLYSHATSRDALRLTASPR